MNIRQIIYTERGRIAISIILGLGLAALFRKSCEGDNCIIIQGKPLPQWQNEKGIEIDGKKYKLSREATECKN